MAYSGSDKVTRPDVTRVAPTTRVPRPGAQAQAASQQANEEGLWEAFTSDLSGVWGGLTNSVSESWGAFKKDIAGIGRGVQQAGQDLTMDIAYLGQPQNDPRTNPPSQGRSTLPVRWQIPASVQGPTGGAYGVTPTPVGGRPQGPTGGVYGVRPTSGAAAKAQAARDDAFTYAQIMDRAQQELDELNAARLAEVQKGADEVAAQYDDLIAKKQKEIEDARLKMRQSMQAYAAYNEEASIAYTGAVEAATAGIAAQKDALEGFTEAVEAGIAEGHAAAVEDVESLAELIGTDNLAAMPSREAAVTEFGDMIKEAAVGRIEDIDRLSAAAAVFAEKVAIAAKEEDEYMSNAEQEKLRMEIQDELNTLAEQKADLEDAKQKAVQAALDQYDPALGFTDPNDAWAYVLETFATEKGWDFEELEAVQGWVQSLRNEGITTAAGARKWVREQLAAENIDNLGEYISRQTGRPVPDSLIKAVEMIGTDPSSQDAAAARALIARQLGVDLTNDVIGNIFTDDSDYENLYAAMELWETHVREWVQRQAVESPRGRTAPNNYALRNTDAYVYRREVLVPDFVDDFLAKFHPGTPRQKYVGGEGYIRDPSDTGGGKAANSDHQSGGAVDLYADTEEERRAIERWAAADPRVSYVVYSGNKYHEGHHVHVSLRLNYRIPTDRVT